MSESLRIEALSGIRIWTVDREPARNAMNLALAHALHAALDEVENDPSVRAVVLTGAGRAAFVSGADLKFLKNAGTEERREMDAQMLRALLRIESLDVPVIAALNGPVVGGGMEVALACDLRICEPHVTFTFKHAAMAVTPGWGGFSRLVATVGKGSAAKLLLTATPVDAHDALRMQFVEEVVPAGSLLARSQELAEAICRTSPGTVSCLKRLTRAAYASGLTLEAEQAAFLASTQHEDHREALAAFFDKRAPRFAPR